MGSHFANDSTIGTVLDAARASRHRKSLGAAMVGFITHSIFADDMMVRYSLTIVNCIGAPLAVLFIALGMRHYRTSLERLDK